MDKDDENIECTFTSEIVCPYCGYEHCDSWEHSDSGIIECNDCNKKFNFDRDVEVTYCTNQLCIENGLDHDWGSPNTPHEYKGKWIAGKHCKVCGRLELVPVNQETKEVED